ncbi:MAG: hypothetical protein WA814_05970 [Candidatus Baltobacteraceae bacterium]
MSSLNGEGEGPHGELELRETLHIQTKDGATLPFEVVGILEDPQDGVSYAVLRHEASEGDEEFIVTDLGGNLLADDQLAQDILDDFLTFVEEADEGPVSLG